MSDKKSESFLSRWSQRKTTQAEQQEPVESNQNDEHPQRSDETLPLWLQDGVDAESKKQALSALFKQPDFLAVDDLNEYDEDFTQFSPLGDMVTHEMKRMVRLLEERIDASIDVTSNDSENTDDRLNDKKQT